MCFHQVMMHASLPFNVFPSLRTPKSLKSTPSTNNLAGTSCLSVKMDSWLVGNSRRERRLDPWSWSGSGLFRVSRGSSGGMTPPRLCSLQKIRCLLTEKSCVEVCVELKKSPVRVRLDAPLGGWGEKKGGLRNT